MEEWILKAIQGAGPYLGTILVMSVIQGAVIMRVQTKTPRIHMLYATVTVQVIAAIAGLAVSFVHDIGG